MIAVELLQEFDCVSCTARQKEQRGCDVALPADSPNAILIDGVPQLRCPRRPIYEDTAGYASLFWLYGHYKRGVFVEAGGLQDQPHGLMSAFKQFDATMAEVDSVRKQREATKRRRASMRGGRRKA